MKVCFLVPDGVGIRNYLYSDIIPNLSQLGIEVVIWHSLDPKVISYAEAHFKGVPFQQYPFHFYKEDILPRFLRDGVAYARLKYNAGLKGNPTILDNWLPKSNLKGKISNKVAEYVGGQMKTMESIEGVETLMFSKHRKSSAYLSYKQDLKKINPDVILCTHQREPNAGIAMLAARDLGIKTVTAIFSWDNLPKGRLTMRSDHYLVWSEYMKQELLEYFPEIQVEQIHILGTPQFDFYRNSDLIVERKDFALKWGLDPEKKWICFSGDDSLTSPYDPEYLRDIAEALQEREDVQVLFRPVPVEKHERYLQVLEKFPFIKVMIPVWDQGDLWSKFFPKPEDIQVLVNLAYHCDTVLNVGSTMALDFSQFDKPGIYMNYEIHPEGKWSIRRVYQFQHFRTFEKLDAVGWINDKNEIKTIVDRVLDDPSQIATERLKWKDKIMFSKPEETASLRIANFLSQLN